jgi:hypothetical protein
MKLQEVVRRKYESYKRKLSSRERITPKEHSNNISVLSKGTCKIMGSLEQFGFGRTPETCCAPPQAEETFSSDFFKNTSLHGLKYIGQKKQHFIEKYILN